VELQGRVKELRSKGLHVAAISYDPVTVLADFARRRDITFPLLSDTGSATITNYGILNTTEASTSRIRGIPFPGTFILDRRGVVTARFFEQNYQERDTAASILTRDSFPVAEADARAATVQDPIPNREAKADKVGSATLALAAAEPEQARKEPWLA